MASSRDAAAGHRTGAAAAAGGPLPFKRAVDSSRRIPTLDGLRAVAIVLVLLAHLKGTAGTPALLERISDFGGLGYRISFVLCGFLITTLLLAERERRGRIAVGDFYVRRIFRILPGLYAVVAVMVALDALHVIELQRHDALNAVTYTMNYHHERSWWLGHIWSLSVQEQFYLLWPAVLVLVGTRRSLWCALGAVAAAPVFRIAVWVLVPAWRVHVDEAFPTVIDSIATGCLLAGLRGRLSASPAYQRLMASRLFVLIPAVGLAATQVQHLWFDFAVGQTITNVAVALCIDWCARHPTGAIGRFLETRPMVWIGTVSYSIYIWQQPFLNRHADGWASAFPFNIILAFAAAAASYYMLERPMLRLRVRLSGLAARRRATAPATPRAAATAAAAVTATATAAIAAGIRRASAELRAASPTASVAP